MDWHVTQMGRMFFEHSLPSLIRELRRLADELKRYNDAQEKKE